MSDKNSLAGDRQSYQAREPIEDDDERLAMIQRDMPPPVPERVANPRIRENRAVHDFQRNSEKMHRATHEDSCTFDHCRSVFPQSVRKASPDVDLYNVSTYQRSILFNNMESFNRKSDFQKAENMHKPLSPQEKSNVTDDRQLSRSCLMPMAQWDVIQAEAMTCQSTSELIPLDTFAFYENQMMLEKDMLQSSRSSLEK